MTWQGPAWIAGRAPICDTRPVAPGCGTLAPPRSHASDHAHPRVTRPCDIVLYGASGFVGRRPRLPRPARDAAALDRRGALDERLQAVLGDVGVPGVGLVVADAADAGALRCALAARTRVVLNTTRPFAAMAANCSPPACARARAMSTSPATPWVREIIVAPTTPRRAAAPASCRAAASFGALGPRRLAGGAGLRSATASAPPRSGPALAARRPRRRDRRVAAGPDGRGHGRELADPFLLNPPGSAPADAGAHADRGAAPRRRLRRLGPPLRDEADQQPRRTAQRSAAAPYAHPFRYQEYLRLGRGPVAALAAAGLSIGTLAAQGALAYSRCAPWPPRWRRAPGEGCRRVAPWTRARFRCGSSASTSTAPGCAAASPVAATRATVRRRPSSAKRRSRWPRTSTSCPAGRRSAVC